MPPAKRALTLVGLIVALVISPPAAAQNEKISRPGEYSGYSEPVYREWRRTSQYVEVRDGTKLAVDIYRPAVNGVIVTDSLPLVWTHDRYHRANVTEDGRVKGIVEDHPELQTLLRYGYIVAAVDVRGGGASFGMRRGPFTPEESRDAYDITEWFAAQPWCDGSIGMYGYSYLGITQYMAASAQPPHLKAIFPGMAMFDMYGWVYPGGVLQNNFVLKWATGNTILDKIRAAAPVDADTNDVMLKAAMKEHADNWNIYDLALKNPYRDSDDTPDGTAIYTDFSPSTYLDAINASGVAIYTYGGWYDIYSRDSLLWFENLTVPQKLVMTPWSHNGSGGFGLMDEHLRWFDYWLKGINNGIMNEPPIYYNVIGAPPETAWRSADQWPLPDQQPTPFYLDAGPSGSVSSANDGLLSLDQPVSESGQDDYVVDYTTTTGLATRWTDGYGGGFGYPDMASNDEKALTYTTPPLEADTEITGDPVAHLWVSATADDADFVVYLEEIDADGHSTYITEGVLKASHRATTTAPWDMLDMPFHRGLASDIAPLVPGNVAELVFDLLPTSNVFDTGHRIRFTITGADADTYLTQPVDPPPTVTIYRDAQHASYLLLPIIPAE